MYNQQSNLNGINYNHRINVRVDYAFDSSNILTATPQLLFQNNKSNNVSSITSGSQFSQTENQTTTTGNNLSGDLLFRHKFVKPGRTISLDVNISESFKRSSGDLTELTDSINALNEQIDGTWQSITIMPSLVYTEPLGHYSQLQINYQPTISIGTADKRADTLNILDGQYLFDPVLSNNYENRYTTQRSGVAYRFSNQGINWNFGVAYQQADIWNEQTFPFSSTISRTFTNILPNAMFNMRIGNKENLRIYYQTTTRAPSITQLQDVVDNSNPLLLAAGNSDLKQSYTHTFMSRYSITDPEEGRSIFLLFGANYLLNYIGSESIVPTKRDTVILGDTVKPGTQLTMPQNFDGYWSVRSFLTYGFPLDFISSTMNLNGGINYSQTPGSINNELNISHAYTFTLGAVIGSNISQNLDFTLTYAGNYNLSNNTLQSSLNSNYYSHTAGLRFNWIFWDGIVFHDEITDAMNTGQTNGYNQNSLIWNMSLAKKLFAKQAGEIKLSVNDLLGQNKSLARTITSSYIQDSRNEVLTQYVMLSFTYTVR